MLHSNLKSNLPIDVILLIAELLDNADLKQCAFVSTLWNATFQPLLYRELKTRNFEKFCLFYRTIEQSAKKAKRNGERRVPFMVDLGHAVRKLQIVDGSMTVQRMQQLRVLCPNVSSVFFVWDEKRRKLNTTPYARTFESPVPFFQHFHPSSLRSLTLQPYRVASRYRRTPDNFAYKDLIPVLQHLPQLESLEVRIRQHFMTIACMELIHEACPNLKELLMPQKSIKMVDDFTVPWSLMKNVDPAKTMESLSMAECSAWTDPYALDNPWFTYISNKYPRLKRLDIARRESHRNPVVSLFPRPGLTVAFRDYFPQLEELIIGIFAGQRTTASPRLVQGIPKVTLRDISTPSFLEWITNEATTSIMRLSLNGFPDDFHELKHGSQLQELDLCSGNDHGLEGIKKNNLLDVNLDIILSCCPALKKLRISRGNIYCASNASAERTKSPLTTLTLFYSVITSNSVLEYIGQWCPELIHLNLTYCMWVLSDGDPIIRINLPQHRLSYCCMSRANVYYPMRRLGGEALAQNRYLMIKSPKWDEDKSPLFHTGHEPWRLGPEFVRRVDSLAIVRWLNVDADGNSHDSDDYDIIRKEAIEAIEAIRSHDVRNTRNDADMLGNEYAPEHNDASCAVLTCFSVDRLYYGHGDIIYDPFRVYLDSHSP